VEGEFEVEVFLCLDFLLFVFLDVELFLFSFGSIVVGVVVVFLSCDDFIPVLERF
jgi:hypothetical protein